jgi:hypothetical protein
MWMEGHACLKYAKPFPTTAAAAAAAAVLEFAVHFISLHVKVAQLY